MTTKAEDRNETIRVNVAANEGAARTGHIRVFGSNSKEALQVISISQAAQGSEPVKAGSVILSFPDENKDDNKVSAYNKSWTAKVGNNSFKMDGFNNNSWKDNWSFIRCGRKDQISTAKIETIDPIAAKIGKVALEVDSVTEAYVNYIRLKVYSDAGFTIQLGTDIDADAIAAGEVTMTIPDDIAAEGLYYVLTIDCKAANKNGIVQISKISYIAAE